MPAGHSQDLVKPRGPTAYDYRVAMPRQLLDGRAVRVPRCSGDRRMRRIMQSGCAYRRPRGRRGRPATYPAADYATLPAF